MITLTVREPLSIETVHKVASGYEKVTLDTSVREKVEKARAYVDEIIANNDVVYGVTTGFGAFKNTFIKKEDTIALQKNLIRSHAVGVGKPLPAFVVRGMMLVIAHYLSLGHSGVRVAVIEKLLELLNADIVPYVPEKGSVGSSGDLAPSAHVVLALMGEGFVLQDGKQVETAKVFKKLKIQSLELQEKEGLALINNTSCMCGWAVEVLYRTQRLLDLADISAAVSLEAFRGCPHAFHPAIHAAKPHKGQVLVAERIRTLIEESTMVDATRIQDQYSLRCVPQIHGAARGVYGYALETVVTELQSVTDNPLFFEIDGGFTVFSGGNFHGEPVAMAMDALAMGLSELANIADRRISVLLDPALNNGLPAFLTSQGGLNSGFMILQYMTAALVSENKVLAHPAVVDSVPTSANIEDLVSMGTISARKAFQILEHLEHVLAIELIVSCQAIDFRLKDGYKLGKGTVQIYDKVRTIVPFFERDEFYQPYMTSMAEQLYSLLN